MLEVNWFLALVLNGNHPKSENEVGSDEEWQ